MTPTCEVRLEILDRNNLKVFAISNHLTGQAVCDDPIDFRHQAIVRPSTWGDGDPEGVRQRAAEDMKRSARVARKLGVDVVVGFTGSKIWPYVAQFPPVPAAVIDAGYEDFATRWNPILDVFDAEGVRFAHEVHPQRDRLRLLVERAQPRGHRTPRGVRLQLGPEPHDVAEHRPGRVHRGLQGPDLPRRLQGHPDAAAQRSRRGARLAPAVGGSRGAVGTSSPPGTATCRGRTPSARLTRSGTPDRSRSSGKTPAWIGCTVRPRRSPTSARCSGSCRAHPSTPPSATSSPGRENGASAEQRRDNLPQGLEKVVPRRRRERREVG